MPSAMGHGPSLGLGLALAQPERGVIVLNGDGCTLDEPGQPRDAGGVSGDDLSADSRQRPVRGHRRTTARRRRARRLCASWPAPPASRGVYSFATLADWQAAAAEALTGPGPVVIHLKVEALPNQKTPKAPYPMPEQIKRLQGRSALPDMNSHDEHWMHHALALAERGRGYVEPNPLVGAVVVKDGVEVGEGWHQRYGGPHAEVNALAAAGDAARGATLYVTLEPCCHHGKTPPCTDAMLACRHRARRRRHGAIRFRRSPARGAALLRRPAIAVDFGVCAEAKRAGRTRPT